MLSILIPAHNEADRIGQTLDEYIQYFSSQYPDGFELIVICNHCTDNTLHVNTQCMNNYDFVKVTIDMFYCIHYHIHKLTKGVMPIITTQG